MFSCNRFDVQALIRTSALTTATTSLMAILAAPVAAEWRFAPVIGVGLEYDGNAVLTPTPELEMSIDGITLDASAFFNYRTEISEFWVDPKYLGKRYDGVSTFDTNDIILKLGYDRSGQRSQIRFRDSFSDEKVRTAERAQIDFDVEEPDDITDADSGQIFESEDRQFIHLAPDWTYRTGERTSVSVGGRYFDISFPDDTV